MLNCVPLVPCGVGRVIDIYCHVLPFSPSFGFSSLPFEISLIISLHFNFYRSLLFQPPSSVYLFFNVSSLILCVSPVYRSLIPTTFILMCFFLYLLLFSDPIFLLSSRASLPILGTQLYCVNYSFSSCLADSASVPDPQTEAGAMHASAVSSTICPHKTFHSPPCSRPSLQPPTYTIATSAILTHYATSITNSVNLFNARCRCTSCSHVHITSVVSRFFRRKHTYNISY